MNNIPKEKKFRLFLEKLRRDVDRLTHRPPRVAIMEVTPVAEETNIWISWTTGKLYFRSPNGDICEVSIASGTPGAGTGAFEGDDYSTQLLELTPAEVVSTGSVGKWGDGAYVVLRFAMPALTPTNAKILKVELTLNAKEQVNQEVSVCVAGALTSVPVGVYAGSPLPTSQGRLSRSRVHSFTIAREFGEKLRDGTWNALILMAHPSAPDIWGKIVGLSEAGTPPTLRIYYEQVV